MKVREGDGGGGSLTFGLRGLESLEVWVLKQFGILKVWGLGGGKQSTFSCLLGSETDFDLS